MPQCRQPLVHGVSAANPWAGALAILARHPMGPAMTSKSHFQYERRGEPLISASAFNRRMIGHGIVAVSLIAGALSVGVLGYHGFEGLPWLDALLNASMILGGMGPVDPLHTGAGKWFASFYALFSGIAFIGIAGVMVAPVAHRIMHRLHLEQGSGDD